MVADEERIASRDTNWRIPVVIVAFGNSLDVVECVGALSGIIAPHPIEIFICENGGHDAFERLVTALTDEHGPCERVCEFATALPVHVVKACTLEVRGSGPAVWVNVGLGDGNLGYAGGINAWLRPILATDNWPGVWVLNPDTVPDSKALSELVAFAEHHRCGMVGSRLSPISRPDLVRTRGLAWNRWLAAARAVDLMHPVAEMVVPRDLNRRLDAPSGASIYATRECLEKIGLMDERYFLYFEDLDWGFRAKKLGPIGYAHASIVPHKGGTTIGSSLSRRKQSPLVTYLEFRNRIIFVKKHFPRWLPWTIALAFVHLARYLVAGSFQNTVASMRGLSAGLLGQTGRPDNILKAHLRVFELSAP